MVSVQWCSLLLLRIKVDLSRNERLTDLRFSWKVVRAVPSHFPQIVQLAPALPNPFLGYFMNMNQCELIPEEGPKFPGQAWSASRRNTFVKCRPAINYAFAVSSLLSNTLLFHFRNSRRSGPGLSPHLPTLLTVHGEWDPKFYRLYRKRVVPADEIAYIVWNNEGLLAAREVFSLAYKDLSKTEEYWAANKVCRASTTERWRRTGAVPGASYSPFGWEFPWFAILHYWNLDLISDTKLFSNCPLFPIVKLS